jgi:hypothetical protein
MKTIKHIGIFSGRLAKSQNNPREVAFYEQWKKEQEDGHTLQHLIGNKLTQRDATVAATVIQWLGSNIGMSFLEESILREPKIKQWLKQRAIP